VSFLAGAIFFVRADSLLLVAKQSLVNPLKKESQHKENSVYKFLYKWFSFCESRLLQL